MTDLQQTLAEIEEMIPRLEWEILDEEQKDEFIAKIVERDLYMATTLDGHKLGPTFWAEKVGATADAIEGRVRRAKVSQKRSPAEAARALEKSAQRHAKAVLRSAPPEQIAELLEEPAIRQKVHKAQDIAHSKIERRSKQNQRESLGSSVADELDEQQRLVDIEGKAFAARRELRDMLAMLDEADVAAARESWREDFLKTLDDLSGRVDMARGLVEGKDLDDELSQLLAREES